MRQILLAQSNFLLPVEQVLQLRFSCSTPPLFTCHCHMNSWHILQRREVNEFNTAACDLNQFVKSERETFAAKSIRLVAQFSLHVYSIIWTQQCLINIDTIAFLSFPKTFYFLFQRDLCANQLLPKCLKKNAFRMT